MTSIPNFDGRRNETDLPGKAPALVGLAPHALPGLPALKIPSSPRLNEPERAYLMNMLSLIIICTDRPSLAEEAARRTARTFITTDLITGQVNQNHLLLDWLLENGISEGDLAWHSQQAIEIDVIGVNYYPEMSVFALKEFKGGVSAQRVWAGAAGMERAVKAFAERYGRPVAITETSTNTTLEGRSQWLRESIEAVQRLRQAGVPLVGYTWWPLFDLIDWVYRSGARAVEDFMARHEGPNLDPQVLPQMVNHLGWQSLENLTLRDYLAPMGLYTLKMQFDETFERVHTPLVDEYIQAISRGVPPVSEINNHLVTVSTKGRAGKDISFFWCREYLTHMDWYGWPSCQGQLFNFDVRLSKFRQESGQYSGLVENPFS